MKVKLPYQQDTAVFVETGDDKSSTMQAIVEQSGFLQSLARSWEESKKKKGDFLIAIKPDLGEEVAGTAKMGTVAGTTKAMSWIF